MRIQLTWLGVLILVLACVASGVLPLPWFTPSVLPTVLVEAELAFLLFLWPLLLPRALAEANPEGGVLRDVRTLSVQIAALAALALPLIALCARTAESGVGPCLASQALPAGIAAGVGLIAVSARRSGRDPSRPYYLLLVTCSAGLPLAGFVLREVGGLEHLSLAAGAPFHAAIADGWGAWAAVGALFGLAGLCAAWPRRSS